VRTALTLHFCDEVFATGARKSRQRVSTQGRVFGLRICRPLAIRDLKFEISDSERGCLVSAFTGCWPIGFPRVFTTRWRSGLMRYRSATVADSHGFPRCLERDKERRTSPGLERLPPGAGNEFFRQPRPPGTYSHHGQGHKICRQLHKSSYSDLLICLIAIGLFRALICLRNSCPPRVSKNPPPSPPYASCSPPASPSSTARWAR